MTPVRGNDDILAPLGAKVGSAGLKRRDTLNLKAAKTLGIKTPQSVLLRADRVIG